MSNLSWTYRFTLHCSEGSRKLVELFYRVSQMQMDFTELEWEQFRNDLEELGILITDAQRRPVAELWRNLDGTETPQ